MEFLQRFSSLFLCFVFLKSLNLLFRYYVFVCIPPGKAVPEMTYTASGGTLNPTHSLTQAEYRGRRPPS